MAIRIPTGDLHGLAYSPDGKYVALGRAHDVTIWDMETAREVRSFNHTGLVWSVAFSPDGTRLASGGGHHAKGEVKVWDLTRLYPTSALAAPTGKIAVEPAPK